MEMEKLPHSAETYPQLLEQIGAILEAGRQQVWRAANTGLLMTYWGIGRHIVEYEQAGEDRAIYGTKLLARLSKDLTLQHGKGFGKSNVY